MSEMIDRALRELEAGLVHTDRGVRIDCAKAILRYAGDLSKAYPKGLPPGHPAANPRSGQ